MGNTKCSGVPCETQEEARQSAAATMNSSLAVRFKANKHSTTLRQLLHATSMQKSLLHQKHKGAIAQVCMYM